MSCKNCKEILEIDHVEPPCIEFQCYIPQPDERGQRIIELRSKLSALNGLVDSKTVLKMYDATIEDIEMLAFLEGEMKRLQSNEDEE